VEEESGSSGARPEVGGDPDRWGPLVGGRGRGRGYPFGFVPGWAVGRLWSGAESFPHDLFIFSLFLFLFLFLFSGLIQIFCIFGSNQFKQISKFILIFNTMF
jgi:hypothetical protein